MFSLKKVINMKIAIIGAGNMGGATARGLLNYGSVHADNLIIIDPNPEIIADFKKLGIDKCFTSLKDGSLNTFGADFIILGVKPWYVESVMAELNAVIDLSSSESTIISLAAGINLADLQSYAHGVNNCIRLIPNTAIEVGQSMSFMYTKMPNDCNKVRAFKELFSQLGQIMDMTTESEFDAAMALASCGIAYAMRYIHAAAQGGVELGIKPSIGHRIVAQTLIGAATLLLKNDQHPEVEIDKVTTPAGITIKGLNAMEQHGFSNAVIQGIKSSKA